MTVMGFGLATSAFAYRDVSLKERRAYKKVIRTRMPPSMFQEWVQNEFKAASGLWKTDWQTFVVDDQDPNSDEYFIIARTKDRPWAFGIEKNDCEKPENFETLKAEVDQNGTPVHMDCVLSIKKNKSFFRYQVTVYEPMYPFWKNPCYVWNLKPGTVKDEFYSKNYNMSVYARNLQDEIYELTSGLAEWRPPKKVKKISVMKGQGQELIGGESDQLTDEERKLPIQEQEKILKKKKKEQENAEKKQK